MVYTKIFQHCKGLNPRQLFKLFIKPPKLKSANTKASVIHFSIKVLHNPLMTGIFFNDFDSLDIKATSVTPEWPIEPVCFEEMNDEKGRAVK